MWEINQRREGYTVWEGRDLAGGRVWAVTMNKRESGTPVEPVMGGHYSKQVALLAYREDHGLPEPGRYGYRVVGGTRREPSGLVGLATTPERANRLQRQAWVTNHVVRERWTAEVWAAVRAEENAGRIPRSLPLSMAAHS